MSGMLRATLDSGAWVAAADTGKDKDVDVCVEDNTGEVGVCVESNDEEDDVCVEGKGEEDVACVDSLARAAIADNILSLRERTLSRQN